MTRPEQIAEARLLRKAGSTLKALADQCGIAETTTGRWVADIPSSYRAKPTRVAYDATDDCWRIYVWDSMAYRSQEDPQAGMKWWPLTWLRFASEEVARAHLERYGDYSVSQ